MKLILLCLVMMATSIEDKNKFENLELFNKALYLIQSQYVKEVDSKVLIEGAIKGMLETLDPYSSYLSKDMMEKMNSDISGHYAGIGIDIIQKDGIVIVISPVLNSPAHKAGIKPGDQILEVDQKPIFGMPLMDIDKLIQGKTGTKVKLGVLRQSKGKIITVSVVRGEIPIQSASYEILTQEKENFAFIRLVSFQKDSHKEIIDILKRIKSTVGKNPLKGIILDLRSNPGGLLEEAIEISSLFLEDGVVVSTLGRDQKNKEVQYVTKKSEKELYLPMIVLINGASASAAEIVAGALADHKRALIMGSTSFGKASVQTVAKLNDYQGIKLTVAQYVTPNGNFIHGKGIIPDIPISELDSEWVQEHTQVVPFVHQGDLTNELNAVVETKEEEKERKNLSLERRIRLLRSLSAHKEKMKNKKELMEKENMFIPFDAKKDYQVSMALHFLKGFEVYEQFYKNMKK